MGGDYVSMLLEELGDPDRGRLAQFVLGRAGNTPGCCPLKSPELDPEAWEQWGHIVGDEV